MKNQETQSLALSVCEKQQEYAPPQPHGTPESGYPGHRRHLCATLAHRPVGNPHRRSPAHRLRWLTRPYKARTRASINLANTSRIGALVSNAISISLPRCRPRSLSKNNIDIEVQRYGPLSPAKSFAARRWRRSSQRRFGRRRDPPASASRCERQHKRRSVVRSGAGVSSGGGIVTQLGRPFRCSTPPFPPLSISRTPPAQSTLF